MSNNEHIDFSLANQQLGDAILGHPAKRSLNKVKLTAEEAQLPTSTQALAGTMAVMAIVNTVEPVTSIARQISKPVHVIKQKLNANSLPSTINIQVEEGTTFNGLSRVLADRNHIPISAALSSLYKDNNGTDPLMHSTNTNVPSILSDQSTSSTAKEVVSLSPGDTIWNIAKSESSTSTNSQVRDIESINGITSESKAERLPINYKLITTKTVQLNKEEKPAIRVKLPTKPTIKVKSPLSVNKKIDVHKIKKSKPTVQPKQITQYVHKPKISQSKKIHKYSKHNSFTSIDKSLSRLIFSPIKEMLIKKWDFGKTKSHKHKRTHTAHAAKAHFELPNSYHIYSHIDTPSGLTLDQLKYALSKINGGTMAPLANDIHQAEKESGLNALFIASAAGVESAWGTSHYARTRNNYFGIRAYTNNPDAASYYSSPYENIKAFVRLLKNNYTKPGEIYYHGTSLHGIYTKYSTSHDSEAVTVASIMNQLHGLAKSSVKYSTKPSNSKHTSTTAPKKHITSSPYKRNYIYRHRKLFGIHW